MTFMPTGAERITGSPSTTSFKRLVSIRPYTPVETPSRRQETIISMGSEERLVEVFTTLLNTSPLAPPGRMPSSFHRASRGP